MSDENQKQNRTILIFIIVSILLHILAGFIFFLVPKQTPTIAFKEPEQKVLWVKPDQFPPPQEIADIEKPLQEKKPEKAKFAGQYDSSVKEELVAKPKPKPKVIKENPLSSEEPPRPVAQRPPRPKVKPAPETPPETPPLEEKPKEVAETPKKKEEPKKEPEKEPVKIAEKSEMEKPEKAEEKPEEKPPEKKPVDLGLKPQDVIPQPKEPSSKVAQKKSLDLKGGPGLEFGRPTAPDLFQHDYFPDYKFGGKTYLNVMKLQDVGYFVKMKRILKMRWNPVPSVRDYVYANRISTGKIECVLGVALDESGRIAEMIVLRSSGLGAYDQEAQQTFRDSSPFSAPPPDFVKDGRVRMSWTFTVYL